MDSVLRLLEGVHGITDDILTQGETEVQHDGRLLTLLETARMNNLSLTPDEIQFKSTDCKFFGHRLTPEGPKNLNKVIERSQWYSRIIDDILPELAKSKFKTLKDATSGYWHVVLDLASSLLTMFNTPWANLDG